MTIRDFVSFLLIIMTLISYAPQYNRLLSLGSSNGLSIASILATTIVAQSQTVNMYYLFKSAPEMRYGIPIATPPSLRDWLNLAQILTQWMCSLLLFALVIYLPTSTASSAPAVLSKLGAVSLWILHILLFILALAAGGRPQDIIFNVIRNINAAVANPVFAFVTVAAFFFQANTMHPANQLNVLSQWTLSIQSFTFLFLAISWPFRLILPPNMWQLGSQPALLLEWYPWVGWACVNNAILAIGQGIMLLIHVNRYGDSETKLTYKL